MYQTLYLKKLKQKKEIEDPNPEETKAKKDFKLKMDTYEEIFREELRAKGRKRKAMDDWARRRDTHLSRVHEIVAEHRKTKQETAADELAREQNAAKGPETIGVAEGASPEREKVKEKWWVRDFYDPDKSLYTGIL